MHGHGAAEALAQQHQRLALTSGAWSSQAMAASMSW
jgi:hypothetical protein